MHFQNEMTHLFCLKNEALRNESVNNYLTNNIMFKYIIIKINIKCISGAPKSLEELRNLEALKAIMRVACSNLM